MLVRATSTTTETNMLKLNAAVVSTLLLTSLLDLVLTQQNCLGQCKVVCDEDSLAPAAPNLARGKKGPKGEKGDAGLAGQKGESNRHVVSKYAKKLEVLEATIQRQNVLIENQSEINEKNSVLISNLSELLQKNAGLIDELSSKFRSKFFVKLR